MANPAERLEEAVDRLRSTIESADYEEAQRRLLEFRAAVEETWRGTPPGSPEVDALQKRVAEVLTWALRMTASERAHCMVYLGTLPPRGAYANFEVWTESWRLDG